MTPSFEAFKLAMEASRTYARGDWPSAADMYRQALELDPDFAWAWNRLGDAYGNSDSTRFFYQQALIRRDRLDQRTASNVEAKIALQDNDLGTALRIYRRMESNGRPWYHNHALILGYLRRYEEAADLNRRALSGTLRPSTLTLNNFLGQLVIIGEFDEAREVSRLLDSLGHVAAPLRALTLASLDAEWDRLQNLAEDLRDDPAAPTGYRRIGARTAAATRLLRGQASSAREQREEDRELAERGTTPVFYSVFDSWYTEGQVQPLSEYSPQDTSALGFYLRSVWSATTGDTATAQRELAQLLSHPDAERGLYGEVPAFLEAVIAAQGRRWQEVVDLAGPGAARRYDVGRLVIYSPPIPRQWLVAEAYRQLGRPDSAAAFFERVADVSGSRTEIGLRAGVYPFVHRRLAQMYTEMGEEVRAADHWNLFLEVFTDPDPELEFMVIEARQALAELAREG